MAETSGRMAEAGESDSGMLTCSLIRVPLIRFLAFGLANEVANRANSLQKQRVLLRT